MTISLVVEWLETEWTELAATTQGPGSFQRPALLLTACLFIFPLPRLAVCTDRSFWHHVQAQEPAGVGVCGVQPWEDTGLRTPRRKNGFFLFVFLSWSLSAGLLPHDSLAEVGPHTPALISNCKGRALPCAPRLECEATTSAAWASGNVSVDQENRVGSWWAASGASHLCCAGSTRSRR